MGGAAQGSGDAEHRWKGCGGKLRLMSIPGLPPGSARPLANFSVQRASVSFYAALAGCPGQISAALLPALIASFSAAVLRCLGAATSVASTIWPPIGR